MGRFGVDPIRAFWEMPPSELTLWIAAADRMSAVEQLHMMRAVAYGGGNLEEGAASRIADELESAAAGDEPLGIVEKPSDVIEFGFSPLA